MLSSPIFNSATKTLGVEESKVLKALSKIFLSRPNSINIPVPSLLLYKSSIRNDFK